jgi:6-phosphogluconolactonase
MSGDRVLESRPAANLRELKFPEQDLLVESLALSIANDLARAVAERGKASLVVSGGRTPQRLFERLRVQTLPWSHIWITLADERWLDPESAESNERLVRSTLLTGAAAAAHWVPMKNVAATPEAGQAGCADALGGVPSPFDVVLLGMGDDGHTASLFPGAEELSLGLDMESGLRCLAVNPKHAPHPRMSLSLPALLDSRRIVLLITGDGKWKVYEQARGSGAVEAMPVRAVLQQTKVNVDVYWAS